jgi:hypothetical protein
MKYMNFKNTPAAPAATLARATALFAIVTALCAPMLAQAQTPFAKPDAAAEALIDAIATSDPDAVSRILGRDWKQVLPLDGISQADKLAFLERSAQSRVVNVKDGRGSLVVGTDPWTLPIPILQGKDGQWRFSTAAGREEVMERRIGANERAAMQVALAYLDAQREYAQADRNGDGLLEYAQKLISSPGKRDGLIWSPALGDESPLGEDLLPTRPGEGYHGYHYKVLTGQGPKAPGGARSYIIGKRMVSGYALLAWPVKYGTTGVMSFIVNQNGTLYQRDLGPQTAAAANGIKRFDPDDAWTQTKP